MSEKLRVNEHEVTKSYGEDYDTEYRYSKWDSLKFIVIQVIIDFLSEEQLNQILIALLDHSIILGAA